MKVLGPNQGSKTLPCRAVVGSIPPFIFPQKGTGSVCPSVLPLHKVILHENRPQRVLLTPCTANFCQL